MFEVIITNGGNDSHSAIYETRRDVILALTEAAEVDGLFPRFRFDNPGTCLGVFVDCSGQAWFNFFVRTMDEFVVLALDSGETTIVYGRADLEAFCDAHDVFIAGAQLRCLANHIPLYLTMCYTIGES